MSALWTLLHSLKSKVWLYFLIGGGLLLALLTGLARVYSAGAEHEQFKGAKARLDQAKKDQRIEAEVDSITATAARERLLRKWARR